MSAPFEPRISRAHGQTEYEDGRVYGSIEIWMAEDRAGVTIFEWSSLDMGKGHTTAALKWLRDRFDIIVANGVGTVDDGVGDIATVYWEHMRSKGLVDTLVLDDGNELPSDWQTSSPVPTS